MEIRFVMDYRGRLTQERFYRSGEVVDIPAETAAALVAAGRAELADQRRGDSPPHAQQNAPGADEIAPSLESLDYRDLQALAKERGIPANQSRDALIGALS